MSGWMKLLLGIAAVGAAVAVGVWIAYEWAKRKIQEWLAAQGLQLSWLQKAVVRYEALVGGIIATVFVNGKTLEPDTYAPVAQQTYTSVDQIQDEGVKKLFQSGNTVIDKDVTAMFQT